MQKGLTSNLCLINSETIHGILIYLDTGERLKGLTKFLNFNRTDFRMHKLHHSFGMNQSSKITLD